MVIHRRELLLALAAGGLTAPAFAQGKEPVLIGVTGPLTGQYAQYGAQWKKGFDLALDEINASGGINGRPLQYAFEDSQSDPRQTVTIARKYVADERIVVEVGDFSSAASMAASPIYQAAGLVQFGFSNSHPDFTKGGDYVWSNAVNQKDEMPLLADFVRDLGLKKIAIIPNVNIPTNRRPNFNPLFLISQSLNIPQKKLIAIAGININDTVKLILLSEKCLPCCKNTGSHAIKK